MHPPFGVGLGTIFETHLFTTDLRRAMEFYGGRLELELACHLETRNVAFYWVGGRGNAMIGVWGVSPEHWQRSHFAFAIAEKEIAAALDGLRNAGIEALDFWGSRTSDPSVHAWMPACGIFFRDPDGNSLEFLAMLDGPPLPALGTIPLSEWRELVAARQHSQRSPVTISASRGRREP